MILLDTSGLLAWLDSDQRTHTATVAAMQNVSGPYVISPFVLAEVDYLLGARVSQQAQLAVLSEVARGALELASFDATDVRAARSIMERLAGLRVGLADASIVVLANRYDADRVLTLDERHFRVLPGPGGRPFRLLPADA